MVQNVYKNMDKKMKDWRENEISKSEIFIAIFKVSFS